MNKQQPPYWMEWLLGKLIRGQQAEIIRGDLAEIFFEQVKRSGPFRAKYQYLLNILSLFRLRILRRNTDKKANKMDAFIYNWKIARRILVRNKFTSLVNITGLAIGFASILLAWIYISNERQYDRFIKDPESTVRISSHWAPRGFYAKTPFPVGPALLQEYSYVTDFFRCIKISTNDGSGVPVRIEDRKYIEDQLLSVDKSFLDLYDIRFVKGDPVTAFQDPLSLLLSEHAAKKYFGNENPVGRIMRIEGKYDMKVTGVVESINRKSHLEFEVLTPMSFMMEVRWKNWDGFHNDWSSPMVWTYAKLDDEKNLPRLREDIKSFVPNRYPEGFTDDDDNFYHYIQPVTDIHLRSDIEREFKANGNMTILLVFGAVSFLVLLIASINFINLTTARSVIRAKEVGIKKVVGAGRGQLIRQFFFEVFVQNLLAVFVAYLILFLIWTPFSLLMGVSIPIGQVDLIWLGLITLFLSALNTLIAGTYPAIFLTSFRPVAVLKGKLTSGGKSLSLRRVLVTCQFIASMVFIACALVISDQLNFIQNKDLGVTTSQLIVVNRPPQSVKNDVVIQAFKDHPEVISATATAGSIPGYSSPTWSFHPEGFPKERQSFNTIWSYLEFVKVFDGHLIAGEDFDRKLKGDTVDAVILNESAVRKLGWTPEEAVGKRFDEFEWRKMETNPCRVVGVVQDFNYQSLHHGVEPVVVLYTDNDFGNIIVRLSGENLPGTLQKLEDTWDGLMPDIPFVSRFMSDSIEMQYQKEMKLGKSMDYFTSLALFITILGLLGLLSFMFAQRTKEISIRKVLGAGLIQILTLVSRDFIKIVFVAFILASIVSYYIMNQWLQDFTFRINIGMSPFLAAGLIAFLTMGLLIGFKTVELAGINPAKTLKDE